MADELAKTDTSMGLAAIGGYDIEKRRKALMRAAGNNGGPGGATQKNYDTKGKAVFTVTKTNFECTNPDSSPIESAKVLEGIIINFENQLQRWKGDDEEVDKSLLNEKGEMKGPLCSSIRYEDPDEDNGTSKNGWSPAPFWSAFHAQKVLPGLMGNGGHDGMQGETHCSTCPLAQAGMDPKDKKCKPSGRLEMVVLTVNKQKVDEPFMAVIKVSTTSIISYAKYMEAIQKKYARSRDQYVDISNIITSAAVVKTTTGGRTYGCVELSPLAIAKADAAAVVAEVVKRTQENAEAIDAEAEVVETKGKGKKAPAMDDDDLPF